MKCPHCGMNIRDNIVVCGYCGGKIAKESEKSSSGAGRPNLSNGSAGQKGAGAKITTEEYGTDEEEEEGGISVYLQPGEQVLIGSLNIAVKKFFFHAYLTNQRIFLIDTQEKKVKVTAKDIPRDTIAGSIIEYSESSDPVLVLSLKSADDEIKTMKLIFIQNGMDRSDEIDEWISLLQEQGQQKKTPAQTIEELPEQWRNLHPFSRKNPCKNRNCNRKESRAKIMKSNRRSNGISCSIKCRSRNLKLRNPPLPHGVHKSERYRNRQKTGHKTRIRLRGFPDNKSSYFPGAQI